MEQHHRNEINIGIGIKQQSSFFFFSPEEKIKSMLYHPIEFGNLYCGSDYYVKRESFSPLLLIYVREGIFHLELGKEQYEATPGQIMLFDCRQPHHYFAKDDLNFLFLHFDGPQAHILCRYINELNGIVIDSAYNGEIYSSMLEMIQLYESGQSKNLFETSSWIYQMLMLLNNPTISPRLQRNEESIQNTIAYIHDNLNKKITLSELAQAGNLSNNYFSQLFKEFTGLSPRNYIVYARVDQAKKLLLNSRMSIAQIAAHLGYPNSSNLIVQFTKRVGCSPEAFREQNQES